MKKFLRYAGLFCAPLLLFFVVLEIIVGQIPNSYSYKYNYVKTNGESIQAVAIGHSQLYDDFKPEFFCLPAFNLSNSNQTFRDSYYILKELLPYMPNLKIVVLPIGYFDVGNSNSDEGLTDRSRYYHKYMHIDYGGQLPFKYMFESLNPRLAVNKVFQYYVQHVDMVGCDSLGTRNNHYLKDRIEPLGYGKFDRYTVSGKSGFILREKQYLISIVTMLNDSNVHVFLVSPPYYWGAYEMNLSQMLFVKAEIENICSVYNVKYLDMESDPAFLYDDFYDETHLNEIGGEKFTKRLSSYIRF